MSSSAPSRPWLRYSGVLLLWTLVGLAFASQFYLSSSLIGRSVSWGEAISYSLGDWYVWAVLSVPILLLARKFPPDEARPLRVGLIHLGAALVISLLYVVLRSMVGLVHGWLIDEPLTFLEVFRPLLVKTFPFNLLVYGVVFSASHALDYYRKYHERTVHALELEKHLAEARLQALLRQLKPHFLFNTLNGIASLMHSDVDAADAMLVRLSELLRLTMNQSGQPLTRLADEVAFVQKYLDIERIRFRDRFTVEVQVDPAVREWRVPSLLLQPLVENAIKHGLEPRTEGGRILVMAAPTGEELEITVEDNGVGMPPGGFTREGIGVGNTRARLAELYGEAHAFALEPAEGGGLCVRIRLPREPRQEEAA
ncbi:sensor histidine kinase [Actomonas aquatica]|uniref:Sensor histidine kinase n=1 Tax=Actomonas aquatica TaxID=2866162 RepID=A0ABZ1CC93_9BACT|nr:sensor histidine kinase [Opitutus sp. WL0086]WRQ89179.1 sensor histidine kinase [Opitutus sp. WL0086]